MAEQICQLFYHFDKTLCDIKNFPLKLAG